MNLKFKKLHPDAVLPKYGRPGDAGLDFTAVIEKYDFDTAKYTYSFGLAVEIPEGHVGLMFPRSSVVNKDLDMANCVGVIDSGYRGELKAVFRSLLGQRCDETYEVGDRVVQLIVIPYPKMEPEWAEELSESERGGAGWGSTGK